MIVIAVEDMERFGGVISRLFLAAYPSGTTIEQMKKDAPQHGWIRLVLRQMGEKA